MERIIDDTACASTATASHSGHRRCQTEPNGSSARDRHRVPAEYSAGSRLKRSNRLRSAQQGLIRGGRRNLVDVQTYCQRDHRTLSPELGNSRRSRLPALDATGNHPGAACRVVRGKPVDGFVPGRVITAGHQNSQPLFPIMLFPSGSRYCRSNRVHGRRFIARPPPNAGSAGAGGESGRYRYVLRITRAACRIVNSVT